MRRGMESAASRLTRLLIGFILALMVMTSISILNEGEFSFSDTLVAAPIAISVMASILLVVIVAGRDRPQGAWMADPWISL